MCNQFTFHRVSVSPHAVVKQAENSRVRELVKKIETRIALVRIVSNKQKPIQ